MSGSRDLADEFLQGGVACAQQVDAQPPKPVHDGLRVEVPPGPAAGEQPGSTDGAACGAQIGPVVNVVIQLGGKRFGHRDGFLAQRDAGLAVDSCDRGSLQGCDPGERLCVEQQQDAGNALGKALSVAGKQYFEPGQALVLGDRRCC